MWVQKSSCPLGILSKRFFVVLLVFMILIPTHELFPTFLCCSFIKCEIQEEELNLLPSMCNDDNGDNADNGIY